MQVGENIFSDQRMKRRLGCEIDVSAKDLLERVFERDKFDKSNRFIEANEQIDIAIRRVFTTRDRAKDA